MRSISRLCLTSILAPLLAASIRPACALTVGDVNADGRVTTADAVMALQASVGLRSLTAAQQVQADVSPNPGTAGRRIGDGAIDLADALAILRFVVGLTSRDAFQPEPIVTTYAGYGPDSPFPDEDPFIERDGPPGHPLGVVLGNMLPAPNGDLLFVGGPSEARTIRVLHPDGGTERIAGDPFASGGYQDGPGATARFEILGPMAWLPDGGVVMTDNRLVRRLDLKTDTVTTLAGVPWIRPALSNGQPDTEARCPDLSGDGPASKAGFGCQLEGIAVRPDGRIYIADSSNRRIRLLTPDGRVTTVAGDGRNVSQPKDGVGVQAEFVDPGPLVLDPQGDLYVSDDYYWIRKVTPDGRVTTVASASQVGLSGNGPAEPPGIRVSSMTWGPDGRLWFADAASSISRIRELTPDGRVATLAGANSPGHLDGPLAQARFTMLDEVQAGPDGTVWGWERRFGELKRVRNGMVETVAYGFPTPLNEGSARRVRMSPAGVAFGRDGSLYFSEASRVRRVTPDGREIRFVGGDPVRFIGGSPFVTLTKPSNALKAAAGLLVTPDGTIDVADYDAIKQIGTDGQVTVLAGPDDAALPPTNVFLDGPHGYQDGPADQALFEEPVSLALDASRGRLYVGEPYNHAIRMIVGDQVTTLAHSGLQEPFGLQLDGSGNLIVADLERVDVATPDGIVSRVATPEPVPGGHVFLDSLARAPDGTLYVGARWYSFGTGPGSAVGPFDVGTMIYRALPGETVLKPWIGRGDRRGYTDGPASRAEFNNISAMTWGPDGALYVADPGNGVIRRIEF